MGARGLAGLDLGDGCGAVPGAGPSVCRICRAPTRCGYATCSSCRRVALALGRPLLPVTAVALVTGASPLYRALRQYKSGEPAVARRQRVRLGALLRAFTDLHLGCLAPTGVDAVTVVPSGDRRRPPPHPLVEVSRAALAHPVAPLLRAVEPTLEHGHPSTDAYRTTRAVTGMAVLLLDDVYTTGAHLQSAAIALLAGGARAVHPLVVGRYVGPADSPAGPGGDDPGRWGTWRLAACARCG
jgi:hypothetical protein